MKNKPPWLNCPRFHHHSPMIPKITIHSEWHISFTTLLFIGNLCLSAASLIYRVRFYNCHSQKASCLKAAQHTKPSLRIPLEFLCISVMVLLQYFTQCLIPLSRVVILTHNELYHYSCLLHLPAVFGQCLFWVT